MEIFAHQPDEIVPYLGTARKSQYTLFANGSNNALQLSGSRFTINGNIHTATDMNPYFGKVDIRGISELGGDLLGREYANFTAISINQTLRSVS